MNVSGKDFNLSAQTDKHKTLTLPNLPDGFYTISFTSPKDSYNMNLPPNAKEKFIEDSKQYLIAQEVEIKDGRCIFSHFALGNRNRGNDRRNAEIILEYYKFRLEFHESNPRFGRLIYLSSNLEKP